MNKNSIIYNHKFLIPLYSFFYILFARSTDSSHDLPIFISRILVEFSWLSFVWYESNHNNLSLEYFIKEFPFSILLIVSIILGFTYNFTFSGIIINYSFISGLLCSVKKNRNNNLMILKPSFYGWIYVQIIFDVFSFFLHLAIFGIGPIKM